jgi:hypothetical protein
MCNLSSDFQQLPSVSQEDALKISWWLPSIPQGHALKNSWQPLGVS